MNEEIRPQVGDVWYSFDNKVTITAIGDKKVLVKESIGEEWDLFIDYLLDDYKLIERDGKPYKPKRILEEGAFYPLIGKCYGNKFIARVHCGRFLYATNSDYCWSEADEVEKSFLIGDKLEIEWPEVTG